MSHDDSAELASLLFDDWNDSLALKSLLKSKGRGEHSSYSPIGPPRSPPAELFGSNGVQMLDTMTSPSLGLSPMGSSTWRHGSDRESFRDVDASALKLLLLTSRKEKSQLQGTSDLLTEQLKLAEQGRMAVLAQLLSEQSRSRERQRVAFAFFLRKLVYRVGMKNARRRFQVWKAACDTRRREVETRRRNRLVLKLLLSKIGKSITARLGAMFFRWYRTVMYSNGILRDRLKRLTASHKRRRMGRLWLLMRKRTLCHRLLSSLPLRTAFRTWRALVQADRVRQERARAQVVQLRISMARPLLQSKSLLLAWERWKTFNLHKKMKDNAAERLSRALWLVAGPTRLAFQTWRCRVLELSKQAKLGRVLRSLTMARIRRNWTQWKRASHAIGLMKCILRSVVSRLKSRTLLRAFEWWRTSTARHGAFSALRSASRIAACFTLFSKRAALIESSCAARAAFSKWKAAAALHKERQLAREAKHRLKTKLQEFERKEASLEGSCSTLDSMVRAEMGKTKQFLRRQLLSQMASTVLRMHWKLQSNAWRRWRSFTSEGKVAQLFREKSTSIRKAYLMHTLNGWNKTLSHCSLRTAWKIWTRWTRSEAMADMFLMSLQHTKLRSATLLWRRRALCSRGIRRAWARAFSVLRRVRTLFALQRWRGVVRTLAAKGCGGRAVVKTARKLLVRRAWRTWCRQDTHALRAKASGLVLSQQALHTKWTLFSVLLAWRRVVENSRQRRKRLAGLVSSAIRRRQYLAFAIWAKRSAAHRARMHAAQALRRCMERIASNALRSSFAVWSSARMRAIRNDLSHALACNSQNLHLAQSCALQADLVRQLRSRLASLQGFIAKTRLRRSSQAVLVRTFSAWKSVISSRRQSAAVLALLSQRARQQSKYRLFCAWKALVNSRKSTCDKGLLERTVSRWQRLTGGQGIMRTFEVWRMKRLALGLSVWKKAVLHSRATNLLLKAKVFNKMRECHRRSRFNAQRSEELQAKRTRALLRHCIASWKRDVATANQLRSLVRVLGIWAQRLAWMRMRASCRDREQGNQRGRAMRTLFRSMRTFMLRKVWTTWGRSTRRCLAVYQGLSLCSAFRRVWCRKELLRGFHKWAAVCRWFKVRTRELSQRYGWVRSRRRRATQRRVFSHWLRSVNGRLPIRAHITEYERLFAMSSNCIAQLYSNMISSSDPQSMLADLNDCLAGVMAMELFHCHAFLVSERTKVVQGLRCEQGSDLPVSFSESRQSHFRFGDESVRKHESDMRFFGQTKLGHCAATGTAAVFAVLLPHSRESQLSPVLSIIPLHDERGDCIALLRLAAKSLGDPNAAEFASGLYHLPTTFRPSASGGLLLSVLLWLRLKPSVVNSLVQLANQLVSVYSTCYPPHAASIAISTAPELLPQTPVSVAPASPVPSSPRAQSPAGVRAQLSAAQHSLLVKEDEIRRFEATLQSKDKMIDQLLQSRGKHKRRLQECEAIVADAKERVARLEQENERLKTKARHWKQKMRDLEAEYSGLDELQVVLSSAMQTARPT